MKNYDILIVGAGFYGATTAERAAAAGLTCLVIDKRQHIGGNAYSEIDSETGIETHRYGAHLFHTSNKDVWNYLSQFTSFTNYQHRVFTNHKNRIFPMPINLATISSFFDRHMTPDDARNLIKAQSSELGGKIPANLEEKAIALIGRPLYEAFIRGYTLKQWQTDPRELPQHIITRLPIRYNFDNRYFDDAYEGLPNNGYTAIFERMLDHPKIYVELGVDYFDARSSVKATRTVYTGPIDRFFEYRFGELGWRTVDFEWIRKDTDDFQGTSVVNYADEDIPYTRIIEFKHFRPDRITKAGQSLIVREYSRFAHQNDEPYYPIGTEIDKRRYLSYRKLADQEPNIYFGGRLGTYRYLDMHQAIASALNDSATIICNIRDVA
jgi:UDP-galactopyranose mutase